ncbi:MAG TPA: hypothetical protein VHV29_18340 [Terriglobales bacterium]|jgi:hypothetical protein|nr:hypothetical protein [Terriglobales bacterium]
MKLGDQVRIIGMPDGLEESPDFSTRSTFEKCLGHEFVVASFNQFGMAELEIQSITGNFGESIWVEPKFLQVISG